MYLPGQRFPFLAIVTLFNGTKASPIGLFHTPNVQTCGNAYTFLIARASSRTTSNDPPSVNNEHNKYLKESITIFTDADVTWCRPWPNTAVHHLNSAHFYPGTPLNLTCWAHNDVPEDPIHGAGLSSPFDIWVKTSDNGCYINENDLRSAEIDFQERLALCRSTSQHPLAGNRPDTGSATEIQSAPVPDSNKPAADKVPATANTPWIPPASNEPGPNVIPPTSEVSEAKEDKSAKEMPSPANENVPALLPNPSLIPAIPLATPNVIPSPVNKAPPAVNTPIAEEAPNPDRPRPEYLPNPSLIPYAPFSASPRPAQAPANTLDQKAANTTALPGILDHVKPLLDLVTSPQAVNATKTTLLRRARLSPGN